RSVVEHFAPVPVPLQHEPREAAQEPLPPQQQLGWKTEIARAEPLERTAFEAELLAKLGDSRDLRITHELVTANDPLFLRRGARGLAQQVTIDPFHHHFRLLVILNDSEDGSEDLEGRVRG